MFNGYVVSNGCDGRVDLDDYEGFLSCLTGPWQTVARGALPAPDCICYDINTDRAIDLQDFAEIQAAFTGRP